MEMVHGVTAAPGGARVQKVVAVALSVLLVVLLTLVVQGRISWLWFWVAAAVCFLVSRIFRKNRV